MTDQTDVREFLHRMADEAGFAPVEPGPVVRKARRRLARTVGATLLTAGALVAGALGAANGLMDASRTQMPQPGGQPTPTTTENEEVLGEFTERFDSPLHGISIGYPSGWRTRAATEPWSHGDVAFGAPDVDVIFHPTLRDELYFAVFSEPLGGRSGRDWVGAGLPPSLRICDRDDARDYLGTDYILRGESAYGFFISCRSPVAGVHFVKVPTATRGYIIYLHVEDERRLQATYDRDWFEAALETVDLRPEDALDALKPSKSP